MKEKNKSYPIIFIGVTVIIIFIAMITYINLYAYNNKVEMLDNSYNQHQKLLAKQNTRGRIYSADGKVLAETVTDDKGNEIRNYPYGKKFAHVVGFASNGRSGLENYANYYLINSNADLALKADAKENDLKFPGDSLYTTLSVQLQEVAYEALSAHKGAIIVTDVKTGNILAMVSKPDFDPNSIDKIWAEVTENENNTDLLNRATQGLYPPGSTFKIITALEYFRENKDSWQDYRFSCNGSFVHGDDKIKCFHGESHGSENLEKSFAKSCNSSFANISVGLDKERFADTLEELLFDKDLPWDQVYSKSDAKCGSDVSDGDIMQLGIGQGSTIMTPLHLNMITSAVANDGVLIKPRMMDKIVTENGRIIETFPEGKSQRLLTSEESQFLTGLMEKVVQEGTATKLKDLPYTAAGKTGSAEFKDSSSDSHAWFTGFAPVEDPEISVTIIVENAGSGGEYAVPIAKRIFDSYFGK